MFERPHHRRIATALEALDADVLAANACLFGGGTAMALRYGEYRESVDIDFLVSRVDGYRQLRQRLTGGDGMRSITRPGHALNQARELRADQYGIRTLLQVDGVDIKFEIVLEGRIDLEAPGPNDRQCGVATLTPLDMATSKLLANSDRWRDDAVMSRDLIDLAMMAPPKALLKRAMDKAQGAYGDSVAADLASAVEDLRARPHRLDQCMQAMAMTTVSKAALWARIKGLVR
ncbi:MAG: nucleotidyl transferase AbiEii/AbiGii toxin family protein [Piscinibacter sp.]|uniref:nucleotidyl transferase AbiEii/AbiGii toxin family protein n=1 Tax=Piscinibacter sp. TaxID=1903157 RepID=UPI003D0FAEC5